MAGTGAGMSHADDPAYPTALVRADEHGLTIREHFAGLAMQGWLANKDRPTHFLPEDDMAYCVKIADALIAELAK
jgi:hypothetical protein